MPHFKGKAEMADGQAIRRAAYAAARYCFETGRILRPRDGEAD